MTAVIENDESEDTEMLPQTTTDGPGQPSYAFLSDSAHDHWPMTQTTPA